MKLKKVDNKEKSKDKNTNDDKTDFEFDADEESKQLLENNVPFFYKYMDFDVGINFLLLIDFRILQAMFMTSNMAHPDEYWQVTQVAYKLTYPDVDVVLPWEFHPAYQLRNYVYPLI